MNISNHMAALNISLIYDFVCVWNGGGSGGAGDEKGEYG